MLDFNRQLEIDAGIAPGEPSDRYERPIRSVPKPNLPTLVEGQVYLIDGIEREFLGTHCERFTVVKDFVGLSVESVDWVDMVQSGRVVFSYQVECLR